MCVAVLHRRDDSAGGRHGIVATRSTPGKFGLLSASVCGVRFFDNIAPVLISVGVCRVTGVILGTATDPFVVPEVADVFAGLITSYIERSLR